MTKKLSYTPLKKKRLYEEVADQIKQTIFNGDLAPGDRLPSERDLAEMFDVGRPTIREAMRTLSVLGLIESNPGFKGSVVKRLELKQYLDAMGDQFTWMIQADQKSFEEIAEARKYIELGIAHAVARHATDGEIQALDAYITDMEAAGGDVDQYFTVAFAFHFKLAELSRNKIYYMTWKLFYDIGIEGYPILATMYPGDIPRLLEVNKLMLDAIKSRDPVRIDEAMMRHAEVEIPLEQRPDTAK